LNFERAYRLKDIDGYDALIHVRFVFKPSVYSPVAFTELSNVQDHVTTSAMFADVVNIEIELDTGPIEDSRHPGYPASDGYKMITDRRMHMFIETRGGG
jgi:hypothetical protein